MEKEEQYIINESEEISIGEYEGWTKKVFQTFPAFQHKNYQLYFFGQLVSLTGTWLQSVAQGWLVFTLTHSAFYVGLVAACASVPILIFSLFGGVIVDRYPKKKILIGTQSAAMVLAFLLGILTLTKTVQVWQIAILAFLLGCVDALDKPGRQAFIVEMVGKESLSSAIALNAGIFNSARAIGPAIAGIIIAFFGIGWAFVLNAASYLFVISALFAINVEEVIKRHHIHPITAIKEGINYSFTHPIIKTLLILTTISAIFGWTYVTLMPVVISQVYHQGAVSLGYFYAATGIGALLATVIISILGDKISVITKIYGGNMLFCLSLILFTLSTSLPLALFFLFLVGFGLIAQFSTINATIQHMVSDDIRGRVMSIYVLMFMGMIPFGSLEMGIVAERFGSLFAIQLGASITLIAGFYFYSKRNEIKKAYKSYKEEN